MKKNIQDNKTSVPGQNVLFTRENYKWMLIGIVVVIIGLLLMVGGKSPDPNVFREDAIYGFRRTVLAPIFVVGGLVIEVYAIMKRPKIS